MSNVKRLYLTHHDPDSTDQNLEKVDKKLAEKHQSQFTDIRLAREGMRIRIPGHLFQIPDSGIKL